VTARAAVPLRVLALAGVLAVSAVGCPCTDSIVNASPWLRWQIFASFGAGRVCDEMTKKGSLLQVSVPMPAGVPPAVGRFFPMRCQSALNDERRTLTVWLSGTGYAWTPVTQKMAYELSVSIEYRPDFHKDGDTVWVWFDPAAQPPPPQVRIVYVEQIVTSAALKLYPVEWFARNMAQTFAQNQLARGFTVVHESEGDDFSLGHLPAGQRPLHPYDFKGKNRYTFVSESTEIHGQQQDFLGPFEVDDEGRALFVKMQVSGPPVDLFLVSRDVGEAWRTRFLTSSPPPGPPPGAPIIRQLPSPASGVFEGWVALPKGLYYLVIDNSASAGMMRPPPKLPTPVDPSFAQSAVVQYLVQLGDAP
jgi:hypothetical protein